MKYFIGIVPPEPIYSTIEELQKKFGDNRLEPHITVRAPVNVANLEGWMNTIQKMCSNALPISIQLPFTGNFGKRVLFVDVQSESLSNFYRTLIPAIQRYEIADPKSFSNEAYHPHLTLGRAWCGFTHDDFAAMKVLANEYLTKQPVTFEASFLRVYHKPGGQARYQTYKDVPLAL